MTLSARLGLLGAALGFCGVAAGAFGAHALRDALSPERLQVFETASRYQLIHAVAVVAVAALWERAPSRALALSGWLFAAGTIVFSGSLYALALSGARAWGAVTPIGGLGFLAGWIALAAAFLHR